MGADIHAHAEQKNPATGAWEKVGEVFPHDKWEAEYFGKTHTDEPFGWRSYNVFGFLGDVRNYSRSPVLAAHRGIPDDASEPVREDFAEWGCDAHSATWVTAAELLAYDYDQTFWNRRVSKNGDGGALADEGEGTHETLREFLGGFYFDHLNALAALGDPEHVRVVMWFDN